MRLILVMVGIAVSLQLNAQHKKSYLVKGESTVCYSVAENKFTTIGPRATRAAGKVKGANINVTYNGFTTQARQAFQEAVDIWESLLQSDVTINIQANWAPLGTGVLGSAGPTSYISDFDGAPKQNVLYPISLAEKISGKEINDVGEADIVATFNSTNSSWHYGLTGSNPAAGKYDLVSIVLHEIGHGLGITHGYSIEGNLGGIPDFFNNRAVAYETPIVTTDGKNLVNDFTQPSQAVATVMTNPLFYSSPLVKNVNFGNDAKLYTPIIYSAGSSIAHLDEETFPAGNENSLMTPFIGSAERVLDPGPIIMNILKDMGWITTVITHTNLRSTENVAGPYTVVATIKNTNGYDPGDVKLNYKTTGSYTQVAMTATGNSNEFKFDLPAGSGSYDYYISVVDSENKTFTYPGVIIKAGTAPVQDAVHFDVGPDTEAPFINHVPKEFLAELEPLELQAIVSDKIGVDNVVVEWKINGDVQDVAEMTLVEDTDSVYRAVITFETPLTPEDLIEYRIRAEDSSIAGNVSYKPSSTTYYEVNVVGLGETQNFYSNNFDDLNGDDFFGDGFTISKPDGFQNGAIHSSHPYPAAGDGNKLYFTYSLKTPIKIAAKAEDAILKFDEIVLVEPGEDGIPWPSEDFFDYVVVEGSTDGGITWIPLADGYDARQNTTWENAWTSTISGQNSTAVGTPAMYATHTFNLHDKFSAGDEVAFRFKLYSDPFSFGWGWSIDNLIIQIDDVPPAILHQHIDFVTTGATVNLETKITDSKGIEEIFFDYSINSGEVVTVEIPFIPGKDQYTQPIDPAALGLEGGDLFEYAFRAIDSTGNQGHFPADGFIKAAIVDMSSSVDMLTANSETEGSDFNGNFFGEHPYRTGMAIDNVSDFSWVTTKAIKVNADNPKIFYKDIALVEYSGESVKDYVVVEASKDGITWEQLVDPYAANRVEAWKTAFDVNGVGKESLFRSHNIDITESGTFKGGDIILIRFRLHSDAEQTGWGWALDNVSIQGPVTAVESAFSVSGFDTWPNPVVDGSLHLKMEFPGATQVSVEFLTTQGQLLSNDQFSAPSGDFQRDYSVSNWPDGFYVVRVRSEYGSAVKKIIKLNSQN